MALTPDLFLCSEDAADVASWAHDSISSAADGDDGWILSLPETGDAEADRHVTDLLAAESDAMPRSDYLARFRDAASRHDAVKWILKVNEFYRFRPVTAYLSVSYLDRFLSFHSLPAAEKGWPMQLLSVACVSVAAKMEETNVPMLVDLQILEPRHVFEPRTVRRMELLLMAALRWRMRAASPFDFLPHFSRAPELLARASDLALSTRRVVDFLGYRPSEIAAAAVLCAADEIADSSAVDNGDLMHCFDKWVNMEVVSGCRQLMEQFLIDMCPSRSAGVQKPGLEPPTPQSPVGVLDAAACVSCDSQKSSVPPIRAEAPPIKRRRLAESPCTASIYYTGDDGKDPERD
ncbi:cyclin-D2-1-like isoform X1 [Typha latifolia]|uniref:cyclin-D2-1-like isoform X1 n=1 Tax=Typha latifolia TaxID=4733 RepID=UPI003C2B5F1A